MKVVVVGAGIAGTAAALAASQAGAEVTMIAGGPGASVLAPGALDDVPWEEPTSTPRATLDARAREVLAILGGYVLPERGVMLATAAGILRPARGADRALLDLANLPSGRVAVVSSDHPGWDGTALARAWTDDPHAEDRGLTFTPLPVRLTRHADEHWLPDADIAARHDDPERFAWLVSQLRDTLARAEMRPVALVLPPWLGVDRERAATLSERMGVPCGEALGSPGGPGGLRFERARDRALAATRVEVMARRAVAVEPEGAGLRLTLGGEGREELTADAVVLATGGLVGGGLAYTPGGSVLSGALPPRARPLLAATLEAPLVLGAFGRPLELPGSLFGAAPEAHAWPLAEDPMLERAGVLADEHGRAAEGLYVAGDLLADRPRTWLEALASGVRAGIKAAR